MSAKERLEEQLMDLAMGHRNDSSDWTHNKTLEKENYLSGLEVEFDPIDAKTVEEVESFKVFVDLTAIEVTTFERVK